MVFFFDTKGERHRLLKAIHELGHLDPVQGEYGKNRMFRKLSH